MAEGTVALQLPGYGKADLFTGTDFPLETAQAMRRGVVESLVGLNTQAQEKDPSSSGCAVVMLSPDVSTGLPGLGGDACPGSRDASMVALVGSGPDR